MRIFKNQFFKTREEAKDFQKKNGGVFYSNVKGSRTKRDYRTELLMLNPENFEEFANEYPYVIAWTETM